jgi:pyridoxal phosphate enzyme (YggS family)
VEWIADNLKRLRAQVEAAALGCGRRPSEVRILAVSKTFPPECIRRAAECGQLCFGENRVQEAREKIPLVGRTDLEWHLIGHLQSNKVRHAVQLFHMIQTVDSEDLAVRIDRISRELGRVMPVLIEVNLAQEPQKSGISPQGLEALAARLDSLPGLRFRGLMTIPPFSPNPEDSRPYFRRLAQMLERLNQGRSEPLTELSMGMTGDFKVAIQEGATLVRIGTAIFGPRQTS